MVNVKPKGPVPVGALEWRIREDVPTNVRTYTHTHTHTHTQVEESQPLLQIMLFSKINCYNLLSPFAWKESKKERWWFFIFYDKHDL
jgi:hypothetical protein